MVLKGLHFLLTYQCTQECDHCFVWSSPSYLETMTLTQIRELLKEAKKLGTVDMIWFEGGEPFLYYRTLIKGIEEAKKLGFKVGALSNAYWATSFEDAVEWLRPLAESSIASLGLSSDNYHGEDSMAERVKNGVLAAKKLNIPVGIMATTEMPPKLAELPGGASELLYRGRAAKKLLKGAPRKPWLEFNKCPHENLTAPERVHVDPLGYIHVCQGLAIGNCWEKPLSEIIQSYDATSHPIIKWLVEGGPAALVQRLGLSQKRSYADACHLCYEARLKLRSRYPEWLAPGQMYGEGLK
ncbi:MAG TPA: radical SAM protein [Candidatus Bathyarchaeia archaeon]|nr:radical SAM protein [Candidatus Bathyarchaeia archaeon]